MLLNVLLEFAENNDLINIGFENRDIAYVINITKAGKFHSVIDVPNGGKHRYISVPKPLGEKTSSKDKKVNIFAETAERTLHWPSEEKDPKERKKIEARNKAYREKSIELSTEAASATKDTVIMAATKFLKAAHQDPSVFKQIMDYVQVNKIKLKPEDKISIAPTWDPNVMCLATYEPMKKWWAQKYTEVVLDAETKGNCFVTGQKNVPIATYHSEMSLSGEKPKLFSCDKTAFEHYGWKSGDNFPVSRYAMTGYVEALQYLANDPSTSYRITKNKQEVQRFVFWTKDGAPDFLSSFFSGSLDMSDPKTIKDMLNSPWTAKDKTIADSENLHFLSYSVNQRRLVLHDLLSVSIAEIRKNLINWREKFGIKLPHRIHQFRKFKNKDTSTIMARGGEVAVPPTLWEIGFSLCRVDPEGKRNLGDIPPNLLEKLFVCAIRGLDIPYEAFSLGMKRISKGKSKSRSDPVIMMIIRAALNDQIKKKGGSPMTTGLDPENNEVPYLLGRIFAYFENIQYKKRCKSQSVERSDGKTPTLSDKYLNAAMASPASVIPNVHKTIKVYLSQLGASGDSKGLAVYFEKELGELFSRLPPSLPKHLGPTDQGKFLIGYYHQKAHRNNKSNNGEEEIEELENIETDEELSTSIQ